MSTRTVERRLKRLIDGRALFALPSFDPRALDGTLVDYAVFFAAGARKQDIDRRALKSAGDRLFHADLGDPGHSFFNLIVSNVADAKERLDWVKGAPGVVSTRLDLVIERMELNRRLDSMVAEQHWK